MAALQLTFILYDRNREVVKVIPVLGYPYGTWSSERIVVFLLAFLAAHGPEEPARRGADDAPRPDLPAMGTSPGVRTRGVDLSVGELRGDRERPVEPAGDHPGLGVCHG